MKCTNLPPLVLDIQPEPCLELFVFDFRQILRKFCAKNIYCCCRSCQGSKAGTDPKGYYRCRQIIATNLRKHRLTRHRSVLPSNPNSSRPRSWSLGNATLVVAERTEWKRVLCTSKPRPSAKEAHPYRKRACLEALRLATTKLSQRGTGYPSWGHPTQLRISRGSTGLITCKECQKTESLWNHTTTDHKEGEQLEDRRNVGASSCNSGDGTDQRIQSLMFMMMMIVFDAVLLPAISSRW